MFRKSCVHHQEDYLYMQFFMIPQVSIKRSQTQQLIFILLRGVSTQLVLTTYLGHYIGHHQVVHSLIFTANYTINNVFVNDISCTSINSTFKIITVAVELKSYSEIKDINSNSTIYTHKISVKTQHLYSIPTTSGLRVATPSTHHQAPLGISPRTSQLS
jgi:hypothetical protein